MEHERLAHLVTRVLADRTQGKELPLEAYCADTPHLLGALRERVNGPNLPADGTDSATLQATRHPCASASSLTRQPLSQDEKTLVGQPGVAQALSARPPQKRVSSFPVIPGYEVQGELGRGGMGVVYKARHLALKRTVALKMIKSGLYAGETEVLRFEAEAEAAARLQHPNIVQIYELGTHEERPFFALEYVEGGTLAHFLNGKPQPERAAAHLVETLARAIHFAHQRGVLHRDLKPGNILLGLPGLGSSRGPGAETRIVPTVKVEASAQSEVRDWATMESMAPQQGEDREEPKEPTIPAPPPLEMQDLTELTPKVTDFGLAKLMELDGSSGPGGCNDVTPTGAFLGTPGYMAPEQARTGHAPIGPGADVYGLGAILYVMLAGRPPFLAATPLETVMQVLNEEPVSPRRLRPALSRDIETICLRCLEKDASRRYLSAAALAEDLRRYLNHEPILARPAGPIERTIKWARRRPALAALLLLTLVGIGVLAVMNYRLIVARQKEQEARELAQAEEANARENFKLAAQAVEEFLTKVSEHPHMKEFDLEDLRKDLLQTAVVFHRKFVERKSDDPNVRAEQGKASLRLARMLNEAGDKQEALRHCEQAEAIFAPLVKEHPENAIYLRGWGDCWNRLAAIQDKLRNRPKAVEAIQKAVQLREDLCRHQDATAQDKGDLATSLNNQATFLGLAGDKEKARPLFLRARDLQRDLVKENPKHPTFQSDLARTHYNMGYLLFQPADVKGPLAELAEAARLWKELVEDSTRPSPALPLLANCLHNMASLALADNPAEAAKLYHEAEQILRQAAERHPSVPFYRTSLARTYLGLAQVARDAHDDMGALAYLHEAFKHQKKLLNDYPKNLDHRAELARTCRELGDHGKEVPERLRWYQEAVSAAKEVLSASPGHMDALNTLTVAHWGRALVRMEASDYKQALLDWQVVLDRSPPARQAIPRLQNALCLARLGLHPRAASEADALVPPTQPAELFSLARLYALCLAGAAADHDLGPSQSDKVLQNYALKAIAFLNRAHQAGCFKDTAHWDRFESDPDFALLRARPEFLSWLAEAKGP